MVSRRLLKNRNYKKVMPKKPYQVQSPTGIIHSYFAYSKLLLDYNSRAKYISCFPVILIFSPNQKDTCSSHYYIHVSIIISTIKKKKSISNKS